MAVDHSLADACDECNPETFKTEAPKRPEEKVGKELGFSEMLSILLSGSPHKAHPTRSKIRYDILVSVKVSSLYRQVLEWDRELSSEVAKDIGNVFEMYFLHGIICGRWESIFLNKPIG